MCRLVLFAGTCTRCNESLTWADLSQELSCLEAKNADSFGSCRRGVDVETHAFDQECDACAGEDEGVAGMDFGDQEHQQYQQQYQQAASASAPIAQSSSKRGAGAGGGREDGEGRSKKRART
ncbi:hypothetical protein CGRA01v4_00512 [Colletotrichum graminicola]|uniref:Uncharacterized protein n=1 Tax=Colletotrichum graminicola (strain M1.001 / M2 / FGSC 10212) TaxID=645133 RepID=E3QQ70_COLGM|nr:uncharacterized protein GLRG_08152 [Colletotrichum graminicola M1.001]EFQ33008.1 hypothetical protein GLRG_08152 [Colletotrichum graminicola M1.001]WDK09234.1 hypothetical protein CGRA01v4_00512 [Colletotrichum graminicola]